MRATVSKLRRVIEELTTTLDKVEKTTRKPAPRKQEERR